MPRMSSVFGRSAGRDTSTSADMEKRTFGRIFSDRSDRRGIRRNAWRLLGARHRRRTGCAVSEGSTAQRFSGGRSTRRYSSRSGKVRAPDQARGGGNCRKPVRCMPPSLVPRAASRGGTGSVAARGNDPETSPSNRRIALDALLPPGERCTTVPVNVDRDLLLFPADVHRCRMIRAKRSNRPAATGACAGSAQGATGEARTAAARRARTRPGRPTRAVRPVHPIRIQRAHFAVHRKEMFDPVGHGETRTARRTRLGTAPIQIAV